ncbi:hypothetical protein [Holospora undulata]|nr:hypothetical protein [Holospora undulata]
MSRKSICDRAGKQFIDWEFGDHYSQSFKRLFERLKKWKIILLRRSLGRF